MTTAAQALVDCLRREGIDHVFGIPGTMNLPILDVLRGTPRSASSSPAHEQGAAFMPTASRARSIARPSSPRPRTGVTNLATGIGAAYKGYVPVISISGAQELFMREKDASQDIDEATFQPADHQVGLFDPLARQGAGSGAQGVPRRARRAGRPGASRRFQGHPAAAGRSRSPIAAAAYRASGAPACAAEDLDRAAALIGAAQRPVFLAGGGVLREDALPPCAARGADRDPGRDTAVLPRRVSDRAPARPRPARAQRLRQPRIAPCRRPTSCRDRRAPRFLLDRIQVRNHQPRGEAHPPQRAAAAIGVVFPVSQAVLGSTRSFIEGLSTNKTKMGMGERREASQELGSGARGDARPDVRPILRRWWRMQCARRCPRTA